MRSEVPPFPPSVNHDHQAGKGLPVVVPLSGKFLAQLFLVPGVIVSGAVLVLLGFSWLAGGPRSPEEFLKGLRNPNPDIRWRTASDLAQVLPRDERLACDPSFGLDLAEQLREALEENEQAEARARHALETEGASRTGAPAESSEGRRSRAAAGEAKTLAAQRELILFLSQCLGHFQAPVGGPLLAEIAQKTAGAEEESLLRRRENAVWALGKLGEKMQHYPQLSPERHAALEAALEREAAREGERGRWAREAQQGLADHAMPSVDRAMDRCSRDPDPLLRQLVAVALVFWQGPQTEATLVRLADEVGRGGAAGSDDVRRLEVRYQATASLARRGSLQIGNRLPVLAEMLDEDQQLHNLRTQPEGQEEQPDLGAVQSTITNALTAVAELHRKQPRIDLSSLRPAIDKLAQNPNYAVEAKRTLLALDQP
jgi:hypothetical protein